MSLVEAPDLDQSGHQNQGCSMTISCERLRELLYLSADGRFFWRKTIGSRARAHEQAGSLGFNGYWYIRLDRRLYLVHRLVWLWHHGSMPEKDIDHIDGDRWNNRISNLREATMSQNIANARLSERNTSGIKGVSWNRRLSKWHAGIHIQGRRKHLGFFENIDDAAAVYRTAAEKEFGAFARPVNNRSAA